MGNKMYKQTLKILMTFAVGFGLFFGITIISDVTADTDNEKTNNGKTNIEQTTIKQQEITELSKEKFKNAKNQEHLNPFGDIHSQTELPENKVKDYIDHMSHQKVEANEKWGFYLITDERIKWMIEAIQENDYKHGERYMHILRAWERDDFDRVDEQHNFIWEMQAGTFGKATGVLSLEEEMNYLESAENIEYGEE
ncbi:DUF6241 domain-containing protein [Alkalibacillus almallahensis]|uniref:DUF6241 domain-containing protein n=1 Tax=Alkalibacillus almallahensis TaxID=1379154 RepID=UPI0014211022|nr:DUF6241 domain-containing protein [Alkalibacillus almallahensis]NIK12755.1 hypothetical protein [Alkalibacillus almallahensis]